MQKKVIAGAFAIVPIEFLKDGSLTNNERIVYCAIASIQGATGIAKAKLETIRKRTCLTSIPKVSKAIQGLQQKGWLKVIRRGYGRCNYYIVLTRAYDVDDVNDINSGDSIYIDIDANDDEEYSEETDSKKNKKSDLSLTGKINLPLTGKINLPATDKLILPATGKQYKKHIKKTLLKEHHINNPPLYSDEVIELTNYLLDSIIENAKYELYKRKKPKLDNWFAAIDKLLRIDKAKYAEVKKVIDYATNHAFWRKVILSADSLRKNFGRLWQDAGGALAVWDEEANRKEIEELARKLGIGGNCEDY